ncbi:MAG: hypothetical protein AAFQ82_01415 [Myxococcota bacterium]
MSPILLLLALQLSNVAEARAYYEQALYDEALAALGPSCDASSDPRGCDEVRAFVYMALGRDSDAGAAFERMLALDPAGVLSTQVAPKIQSLYDERQQGIAELLRSGLGPVAAEGDDVPVPVKLETRGDIALLAVTLIMQPESGAETLKIPMRSEGGAWVAMVVLEEPDEARYSVELELAAGAVLTLGGSVPQTPLTLTGEALVDREGRIEIPDPRSRKEELLPPWAWWTIGGVAVVGSVAAIILLSSGSSDGDLTVGVTFDGDAP